MGWFSRPKVIHEDNAYTAIGKELDRLYALRAKYCETDARCTEEQKKITQEHFWTIEKNIGKFQNLLIELAQKSADPEHLAKIKDMQQVLAETILLGKDVK